MDINKLKSTHKIADLLEDEEDDLELSEELAEDDTVVEEVLPDCPEDKSTIDLSIDQKFSDGTEVINGKFYRAYGFKPGNKEYKNRGGMRVEGIQKILTMAKSRRKSFGIKDKSTFKLFMSTAGVEKVIDAYMNLEYDKDIITAFLGLAPYVLPKIASVEDKFGSPIPIDGMQKTHTITIKNMRTGLTKVIPDE